MFNIEFTPESFIVLPFAIMLDLIPLILLFFGVPSDGGVTDIMGILFFTPWLLLRGNKNVNIKETRDKVKNVLNFIPEIFTGKTSKFFIAPILELIPVLEAILPCWILLAICNLQKK